MQHQHSNSRTQQRAPWRRAAGLAVASLGLACLASAQVNAAALEGQDAATDLVQKLGASIAMDASFLDDQGRQVKIADYFDGKRPTILNLGYYNCPSICGPVMNAMVDALQKVDLQPGKDYQILSVSINPKEGPELAAAKKKSFLKEFQKEGADQHWHFLTGDETNRDKLSQSVGWNFRWNPTMQDYDHRPVLVFLSPTGKITRYFEGVYYEPRPVHLALVEASEGEVGSAIDRFILSCYSYNPASGKYNALGPMVMTIGGALTLLGLAVILFVLWRREWRQAVPLTP